MAYDYDNNNIDNENEESYDGQNPLEDFISDNDNNNNDSNNSNQVPNHKIKKKGTQKVKKVVKDAGKKLFKQGAKLLAKGFSLLLKALIPFLPYILAVIGIIILFYCAWDILFESSGKSQDYQNESPYEYNSIVQNPTTGDFEASDISMGNKIVKAFYTYFSEKSIWVTVTDTNGNYTQKIPIQYGSSEFNSKYKVGDTYTLKDKYEREKMFYMSPNALWALDEYLNDGEFRFPEQFIQPVYHDPETYVLKDLTDENGDLVAESSKYITKENVEYVTKINPASLTGRQEQVYIDADTGKDTFSTKSASGKNNTPKTKKIVSSTKDPNNAKEKGVWDYGFGSILNYQKFEEENKGVGVFTTTQVWDIENERLLDGVDLETAKNMVENEPDKYMGYNNNYYKDKPTEQQLPSNSSYMINRVTSPAGFITNKIEQKWVDTGKPWSKRESYTQEVYVWREREVYVYEHDPADPTVEKKQVYIDKDGNKTFESKYKENEDDEEYIFNTPLTTTERYKEYRDVEFTVWAEGTVHEYIPQYVGDPDVSGIKGTKYYTDYLTNYASYVPIDVMSNFGIKDITDRTGTEQSELLRILERQPFGGTSVEGSVDMSSFTLGDGASKQSYAKAMQFFGDVKPIADAMGVDPYFVIAMIAQESGGNLNSDGMAFGLMQLEKKYLGGMRTVTYLDGSTEQVNSDISNLRDNAPAQIKLGIQELRDRAEDFDYNLIVSLYGYNYGAGGIRHCIKKYVCDKYNIPFDSTGGAETSEVKEKINEVISTGDLGWLEYRQWYSTEGHRAFANAGGGTWNHMELVLQYYVNPTGDYPWILDKEGNKHSMDGSSVQMGSGTLSGGNDSWLTKAWDKIVQGWNSLFPNKPKELNPKRTYYENKVKADQAEVIIKMMLVMEEGKYYSDYEEMTDEDWQTKYHLLFSNPIGKPWKGQGGLVDVNTWFKNGYTKPLKFNPLTVSNAYNPPDHNGIDIVAPNNSEVVAVANGKIVDLNNNVTSLRGKYIKIEHEGGIYTIYGGLSSINVDVGDTVTSGQVIGKSGSTHKNQNVLHFELIRNNKSEDPSWMITGNFNANDYNITGSDAQIIQQVIDMAYTKVGCMYTQTLSLRKGPNSFDCSGFTWWLYHTATGVSIGNNTTEQDITLNNYRVNPSNLQPGDILMPRDTHHVVLYVGVVDGKDTIIHASNYRDGVKISQYAKGTLTSYYPLVYRPIAYINAQRR